MSRKRILSLLLSAAMLATLLAGCGGQGTSGAAGSAQSQPSGEKTQVVLWHTYTDAHEEALLKVVDSFNTSQDEYEVVAEQQPYSEFDAKLMQAVRNGTGPDMVTMFPSDAINYMEENLLVDLAPYINDPEIGVPNFEERMSAGMYEEITQWGEDSIYLFPITATGEVLFYNKTLFDKYNLDAPQTWSDVEAASKVIYENEGIPGFGTDSVTDTYQCLIRQAGSGYIDAENKTMDIDEAIGKEKLQWFADGVQAGYFRLVGEDQYFSNPFGSQAVASYIGSSAGISYVQAAIGDAFEMGCVPIPQEGPVKYISQWASNYVCLSKDEAHARGAYLFMKHFASEEIVVDWAIAFGAVPVFAEARENERFQEFVQTDAAIKALTEEIDYTGMLPSIPGAADVRTEIDKMIQNVSLGLSDADTAYDAFITASNNALAAG